MDLLIEHGRMEWQGTLRETYNKYLHPDVLDMTNPKMFDMLYNGEVFSCFQFMTVVGNNAIRKLKARSFEELCVANSLMRLKCEGEQPLDRYIRFKNNPLAWTEEMTNYGLTLEEQQVLKDHLINNCGVCDTQEELMRLVMDKKIGGFTLTEANNFRKAIAKKSEKKQKEQKKLLFEKGVSLGNRKEFLEYVWDYEIRFSLGLTC